MPSLFDPSDLGAPLRESVRAIGRFRNGLKYLTGEGPPVGLTPRDVIWQRDKATLYRFHSDQRSYRPPLLLVMSLVSKSYIFDLRPGASFVEVLLDQGLDVFMLDWGVPDERDAGNTLETYCDDYLPRAVRATLRASGARDATVLGYCLGGVLALLYVASHLDDPVRNLALVATPVDFHHIGPMASMAASGRLEVDDFLDQSGNVPADVIVSSFRMLQPLGDLSSYVNLWHNLWDDEYLASHQAIMGWAHDQIPLAGAFTRQMIRMLTRDNAVVNDAVVLGGRRVHVGDITCPVLSVMAEEDHITPPRSVGPLIDLVGSADRTEMRLPARHVGIIYGRRAVTKTLPAIAQWIVARSGRRRVRPLASDSLTVSHDVGSGK
jgi:polyhydroxyalkanoate synthase